MIPNPEILSYKLTEKNGVIMFDNILFKGGWNYQWIFHIGDHDKVTHINSNMIYIEMLDKYKKNKRKKYCNINIIIC